MSYHIGEDFTLDDLVEVAELLNDISTHFFLYIDGESDSAIAESTCPGGYWDTSPEYLNGVTDFIASARKSLCEMEGYLAEIKAKHL